MQKSVNISNYERGLILGKAIEMFMKTAKVRHPDPDFHKTISQEILEYNWDLITDEILESPEVSRMQFCNSYEYMNRLDSIILPNDVYIYSLCKSNTSYTKMLTPNFNIMSFSYEDIPIPERLKFNNTYLYPFTYYGHEHIWLSDNILNKIDNYNESMETIYSELGTQLSALTTVINSCKTTKAFISKLPNLTSLYPTSVVDKLSAKNRTEHPEMTEEQRLMQDAITTIATANMLGD